MIEAVIFDCDGVLVDSEVLAVEVEMTSLAEAGLHYDIAAFKARFMGKSDAVFYAELDADSQARLGRPLPADFRARCHSRLYAEVAARLEEVPGARAAIAALNLPIAVASSSTARDLEAKLRKAALWDACAPHIYSADDVVHAKPAPDLFLHAAQRLGVRAPACLVLEDRGNGVAAARGAGMRVWGFLGGGHADDATGRRLLAAGAERLIADWGEASALLVAIAARP